MLNKINYRNLVKKLIIIFICATFIQPLFAQKLVNTKTKKRIAILDITVNNASKSLARIARTRIEMSIYKSKKFRIIERNLIEQAIKDQVKSKKSISESRDIVALGKFLLADYVLIGNIDFLDKYTITIKIVEVKTGEIVYSESAPYNRSDEILKLSFNMGKKLTTTLEKIIDNNTNNTLQKKRNTNIYMSIMGGYSQPTNTFSQIVNHGYNTIFQAGLSNIFTNNLTIAIETGYSKFNGKENIDYTYQIPLLLYNEYSFKLSKNFYISPTLSFGTVYNYIKTDSYSASKNEPIIKSGINLRYMFNKNWAVILSSNYVNIFEKDGNINYYQITGGLALFL